MQQRLLSSTLFLSYAQIASSTSLLGSNALLNLFDRTSPAFSLITPAPVFPALLQPRCENPCGFYTQLCCGASATCYTDTNSEAQCATTAYIVAATAAGGYWQYYTSTYVETDLVTKTAVWSTYVAAPVTTICTTTVAQSTQTAVALSCDWAIGESSCGNICCSSTEYCLVSGQCAASANTETYSAPLRVTASTLLTVTETVSPTITVPFESAVATGTNATIIESTNNSTGLSAGAIAGIVIGVIAGIIILLLLCIIFCFRAAWDGLKGIFGIGTGGRRRRETVEVEEYSRHGSRSNSRRWVEERPGRPERKSGEGGGGFGFGTLAAGLGGLAVLLGMRNSNKKRRDEKTEYSSSSGYYDSEYSASSSDRRTRDTRRSRG